MTPEPRVSLDDLVKETGIEFAVLFHEIVQLNPAVIDADLMVSADDAAFIRTLKRSAEDGDLT